MEPEAKQALEEFRNDPRAIAGLVVFLLMSLGFCVAISNVEEKPEQRGLITDVVDCQDAVKKQLLYPSKADFDFPDSKGSFTKRILVGKLEVYNSFGAMIPRKYMCIVELGEIKQAKVY